jgi:hypothetical protein
MGEWSMALSSHLPAMRSITTAAIGLLTAAILASCGGNNAVADPTTTPPSPSGEVRPGCGTYCQTAGPLQGASGAGQYAVTIVSSGTVTLDPDGYLPVTLTCNLSVQCRGSLIAAWADQWIGRADLLVNAGATATLGVGLPAPLVAYIRAHNPPCPTSSTGHCPAGVGLVADTGPSFGCNSGAHSAPVGLPNCGDFVVQGWRIISSTPLSVVAPG